MFMKRAPGVQQQGPYMNMVMRKKSDGSSICLSDISRVNVLVLLLIDNSTFYIN